VSSATDTSYYFLDWYTVRKRRDEA